MTDTTTIGPPHDHDKRVHDLFMQVVDLPQQEQRAFLDKACGDDTALRNDVLELLRFNEQQTKTVIDHKSSSDRSQRMTLARGETIGPYTIIDALGEGGFGVVYLAKQTTPVKRLVALKIIKPGMDTKAVIARFEAERQALAMMDHSSIARVYEAGATPEGRPYFAMEFVKGEPINAYCDRHKLDTQARLELFAQVCDAIQHAHQKGVIHRDLKPGNILVTIDARRQPQPKVIDFGIAKATAQSLTEKTLFTEQGQLIGTPEYMSPEQAEMSAVNVDTRSDVYSLGVILYELLSGKLPFDPESLRQAGYAEIQRIIREDDPPKPSTKLTTVHGEEARRIADARKTKLAELQSTLRRELEWIPLKALRKERTERYSSAEDLADDVRRYLKGEPLEAGPESAAYRFRKLVRRNKGPFIAAALIGIAMIAGIIGTTIFAIRAAEESRRATVLAESEAVQRVEADKQRALAEERTLEAEKQRALAEERTREVEKAKSAAFQQAYYGNIHAASEAIARGDLQSGSYRLNVAHAAMNNAPPDEMPFEWNYLNGLLSDNATVIVQHGQPGRSGIASVSAIAFSLDGRFLASSGHDGAIRLWDMDTGEELVSMDVHDHQPRSMIFSPDGSRLTSTGMEDTVIWNTENGEEIIRLPLQSARLNNMSHDGTRVASYSDTSPEIQIWDLDKGVPLSTLPGHEGGVHAIDFSLDGNQIVSGGDDAIVRVWDTNTGKEIAALRGHDGTIRSVAFSPDGRRLASGGDDTTVRIWHKGLPKRGGMGGGGGSIVNNFHEAFVDVMDDHEAAVNLVAFGPSGDSLTSGSTDFTVCLWDAHSTDATQDRPRRYAHDLAFRLTKTLAGTVTQRQGCPAADDARMSQFPTNIRLYDTATGKQIILPKGHEAARHNFRIAFSQNGDRMASFSSNTNTIRLWHTGTHDQIRSLLVAENTPVSYSFSPDGSRLATAGGDKVIRVIDTTTSDELCSFKTGSSGFYGVLIAVAFSADGSLLAWTSNNDQVRVCDAHSGEILFVLDVTSKPYTIAFSPDSSKLASGGVGEFIQVWDMASGQEIAALGDTAGNDTTSYNIDFSPDGSRLAAGTDGNGILIWDIESGNVVRRIDEQDHKPVGDRQFVSAIAFSPDGSMLVSTGGDKRLHFWDAQTGDEIRAVSAAGGQKFNSLDFNPDGSRLVSFGRSSGIPVTRLWDTDTGEIALTMRGRHTIACPVFSPDGTQLAGGGGEMGWTAGNRTVVLLDTRSREHVARERMAARKRVEQLSPLVESWIEKTNGDSELVVAMLEREVKNRPEEEESTLRNLVLKQLVALRHAQAEAAEEPAASAAPSVP